MKTQINSITMKKGTILAILLGFFAIVGIANAADRTEVKTHAVSAEAVTIKSRSF